MSFRFWSLLLAALALASFCLDSVYSPAALGALGVPVPGWAGTLVSLVWPVCLLGLLALVLARLCGTWSPRGRIKQLQEADAFRMSPVLLMALFFLAWVGLYAPGQLVVLCFKPGAVCLGGYLGYWTYRQLFPFFRPSGFLVKPWRETRKLGFVVGGPNYPVAPEAMIPFLVSACLQGLFVIGGMLAVGMAL